MKLIAWHDNRSYEAHTLDAFARAHLPKESGQDKQQTEPAEGKPVSPSRAFAEVSDSEIWDCLTRMKKRRYGSLLLGDLNSFLKDYNDDHSAADLALCNDLAYATGRDARRMDGLFRETPLYRPKWDERHGEKTYGEMTIEKAISGTRNVWQRKAFRAGGAPAQAESGQEEPDEPFERLRRAYERATGGQYAIGSFPFRTCRVKNDRDGNELLEPLCDFVAVPVESVIRDDGIEQVRELVLEGYDHQGRPLPRVSVRARELDSFKWAADRWPGAVVEAGNTKKDNLRAAIQKVERETAIRKTVYTHTGWRKLEGGKWHFLYHGGAVNAEGVSVELDGNLSQFSLAPVDGLSACQAARESLCLLDIAPDRVSIPLLATMYLAPLSEWLMQSGEPVNHVLMLQGKTQSRKSVLSALFLGHFGRKFTYQSLPFNFNSTANSIREGIFRAKDVPAVVDDFHPQSNRQSVDKMTGIAQELIRAWGDHAARGRMMSDGQTIRASRPPRGIGVMTAEYLPELGESGLSRLYVVPMKRGEVDVDRLTDAQEKARAGVYAQAMRGYIEWIAEKVNGADGERYPASLGERFRAWRRELQTLSPASRLGAAGAYLMVAAEEMSRFFQYIGAIDEAKQAVILQRAQNAILAGIMYQAEAVAESDPLRIFAGCMAEIQAQHGLFSPTGIEANFIGEDTLGFQVMDDGGQALLYVYPRKLFAMVRKQCEAGGSAFPVTSQELWSRLFEAGISTRPKAATMRIPGVSRVQHVICMNGSRLDALLDGGETQQEGENTWRQEALAI